MHGSFAAEHCILAQLSMTGEMSDTNMPADSSASVNGPDCLLACTIQYAITAPAGHLQRRGRQLRSGE